MSAAIALRDDFEADELRLLAERTPASDGGLKGWKRHSTTGRKWVRFAKETPGDAIAPWQGKNTTGAKSYKTRLKAARALLDWSQEELASAAEVSIATIKRLESNEGPVGGRSETGDKIHRALQGAGIEFIDENGGGPGVRLRRPPKGKARK